MKTVGSRVSFVQIVFLFFVVISFFGAPSFAEVIFQDNFDNQVDWQPRPASDDVSPSSAVSSCGEGDCSSSVPAGWSFYRSAGRWWGPTYQDTIRINNENYRGASGKGYTQWNEANSGEGGDGWGADGILAKYFGTDYPELYVQVWIKFKPGFNWAGGNEDILKLVRVTHYNGSGSCFKFFSSGNQAPLYQFYAKQTKSYGYRQMHGFRCNPQESYYYCPDGAATDPVFGGEFTDSGNYGDGQWHRIDIHLKMNTYAGSGKWNNDGVIQYWHDGALKVEIKNKKWIVSGTDSTIGWNFVGIGGNAYNNYSDDANHAEQWYAFDDIVISTTPIAGENEILPPLYPAILGK